ncbi:MAG: helix-turn-helix domain-containing protein [Deltaproteobacteria bacterium]|nr:helix-turn-helix domain-containing protein [Deltaproteobacteria bacterium]
METRVVKLNRLLTVDEVSELLGLTNEAIWRYVRSRRLPAIRIGRQIRFEEAAIRRWVENGGCGVKENVS